MRPKPIFDKIPGGSSGQYLLTPEDSSELNLHVYQVTQQLEDREHILNVKLHIDIQLHPKGVLFVWKEKDHN